MAAISLFWYCLQRAESYINCSCAIARSHSNGFFSLLAKKPWNFLYFYFKKPKISQFLSYLLLTGNRSLCCPIWPVIILVIKQIRLLLHSRLILLITCMITDRLDFTQSYYHYKCPITIIILSVTCVAEVVHLAMSLPWRQVTQVWLLATCFFFLFGRMRGNIFLVFGMKTKVEVEPPQPSSWMHPWSTKDNIL